MVPLHGCSIYCMQHSVLLTFHFKIEKIGISLASSVSSESSQYLTSHDTKSGRLSVDSMGQSAFPLIRCGKTWGNATPTAHSGT